MIELQNSTRIVLIIVPLCSPFAAQRSPMTWSDRHPSSMETPSKSTALALAYSELMRRNQISCAATRGANYIAAVKRHPIRCLSLLLVVPLNALR